MEEANFRESLDAGAERWLIQYKRKLRYRNSLIRLTMENFVKWLIEANLRDLNLAKQCGIKGPRYKMLQVVRDMVDLEENNPVEFSHLLVVLRERWGLKRAT